MRKLGTFATLTIVLGLFSAASAGPRHPQYASSFSVGQDLAGNACVAQRVFGDPLASRRDDRVFDLRCGREGALNASVGQIVFLVDDAKSSAQTRWEAQSACDIAELLPTPTVAPGDFRYARRCQDEKSGEFGASQGEAARVNIAANLNGRLIAGSATLVAAPALERGIRLLLGEKRPVDSADASGPVMQVASSMRNILGEADLIGGNVYDFNSLRSAAYESNQLWLFGAAEAQFNGALSRHAELWPNDRAGRADLLSELALNLSNQKRFNEAVARLNEAEGEASRAEDRLIVAKVQTYRALNAMNAQSDDALARAQSAHAALRAWRDEPQRETAQQAASGLASDLVRANLLEILAYRAEVAALRYSGESDRVDTALGAAEAILRSLPNEFTATPRAALLQDRATQAMASGDAYNAKALLLQALSILRQELHGARNFANLLIDLGVAQQATGEQATARASFAEAFALLRSQPDGQGASPERALPYLRQLTAAHQLSPNDAALQDEIVRAAETVANPAISQAANAASARLHADPRITADVRRLQDLEREIRRLQAVLSAGKFDQSGASRQQINEGVNDAIREREVIATRIATRFPVYANLLREPISRQDVEMALDPNEMIVKFVLGEKDGVGLLLDRSGVHAFNIAIGEAEAFALVQSIRNAIQESKHDVAFHDLFGKLFGPIREKLDQQRANATTPTRLLFDVQGALASLPLGILAAEPVLPGAVPKWLMRDFLVVNLPGLRAFVASRKLKEANASAKAPSSLSVAAFGAFEPFPEQDDKLQDLAEKVVKVRGLSPNCINPIKQALVSYVELPGTLREIGHVEAVFSGSSSVIGKDFTKTNFIRKSPEIETADILFFGTHGIYNADERFSGYGGDNVSCIPSTALLLSADNESADPFLDPVDIVRLQLKANLVVLSACDSGAAEALEPVGAGFATGGDALSGLARAFAYAGARSVMVSHWKIPDDATADLMEPFFKAIAQGRSAPEALWLAQLTMIDKPALAPPINWAAFTIVGIESR